MQPAKGLSPVIQVLYVIFFISVACTFRAVTSIVIVSLLVAGVIKNRIDTGSFFNQKIKNPFFYGCLILYGVHLLVLLYTTNKHEGWLDVVKKTGLVLIPLAVFYSAYMTETTKKNYFFPLW